MLKKTISILSSLSITAIASTSVISCITPQYANGEEHQRVVLTTDGGHIDDKSFNEDSFLGIKNFMKNEYNLSANNDYVEASDSRLNSVVSAYKMAVIKKANALVMPGFTHMNYLPTAINFLQNKNIVLIDGIVPSKEENPLYKNVISVLFDSQIAGFQAGFDSSYWATEKDENGNLIGDANKDGEISIGTFAGASNKYGVDNYIWGLVLGISLFNKVFEGERAQVKLANVSDGSIEGLKLVSDSDPGMFTGSFEIGAATKSGIVGKLINQRKADIIFPVAGPQIDDVINFEPSNGGAKPYLIGVDVDQAASYPTAANSGRFITSATKNIHSAVEESLKHASQIYNKNNRPNTDVWDGTKATPYRNWSIALTSKDNIKYKLSHNFLKLYDEGQGNNPVNEEDKLINFVNNAFANDGLQATEYMDGNKIVNLTDKLIEEFTKDYFKNMGDESDGK